MMATIVALQKQKQSSKLSMIMEKKTSNDKNRNKQQFSAARCCYSLSPAGQLCNCCAHSMRTVFIFIVVIPLEPNYLYLIFLICRWKRRLYDVLIEINWPRKCGAKTK